MKNDGREIKWKKVTWKNGVKKKRERERGGDEGGVKWEGCKYGWKK